MKKFQRRTLVGNTVNPVEGFDFAGGSSGSALFDSAGQIIGGALSVGPLGDACHAGYTPAATIVQELENPPAPPAPFDVMLVLDRSGSMSSLGTLPGRTKMQEAHDAASLFVQLIRSGAGDRLGLVSFSTTANRPADSALGLADAAKKLELVGPAPFSGGKIGALAPGGMTSIGDGLDVAIGALPVGTHQRAILLMTDGLQNTPPMISAIEGGLGPIKLVAIGFGAESNLDSALLSRVARAHNGLYTRANNGLELKKFFSLAFGNIFEAGALTDPEVLLRKGDQETAKYPFDVCDEERITAILGWDDDSQGLALELHTPGGVVVSVSTAGIESARGGTWEFHRIPLPLAGEREGTWHWSVRRIGGGGEFPPPADNVRLFVTVVADGGPRIEAVAPVTRCYTGDVLRPSVALRYENGSAPEADVVLEVEAPDAAVGEIVANAGLSEPETGGDPLSGFHATLKKLGGANGYFLPTRQHSFKLFDDGEHGDGGMEPDGVYGDELPDVTRFEGTYRLHARATYGTTCRSAREAQWSVQVELGIDPGRTTVEVRDPRVEPGGRRGGLLVVTPRDQYGNRLGPGRGDQVDVSGVPGTTTGSPVDNGDGTYSADATWDPASEPGVVISQPERPPATVTVGGASGSRRCPRWLWPLVFLLLLLLLIALIVIIWLAS